jgi:hypothetical protein
MFEGLPPLCANRPYLNTTLATSWSSSFSVSIFECLWLYEMDKSSLDRSNKAVEQFTPINTLYIDAIIYTYMYVCRYVYMYISIHL